MLGLGLAPTGGVFAQAPSCKADIAKFCAQVTQGDGRVAQCLKQNKDQLSASCKERISIVAEQLKGVHQACEDDIQTFCAGIQPRGGRVAACLKQNREKLSGECRAQIAKVMQKK